MIVATDKPETASLSSGDTGNVLTNTTIGDKTMINQGRKASYVVAAETLLAEAIRLRDSIDRSTDKGNRVYWLACGRVCRRWEVARYFRAR